MCIIQGMKIFCCAVCGSPISLPVVELEDVRRVSLEDQTSEVPRGTYLPMKRHPNALWVGSLPDEAANDVLLNLEDAINTHLSGVLNGCCGIDGCDGINAFCPSGHEIGTEFSDCWGVDCIFQSAVWTCSTPPSHARFSVRSDRRGPLPCKARQRGETGMATTYVALLRGVNVGGKNKLPMKDLKELFVAAGAENVRTYIQSGNVVFEADPDASVGHVDLITRQIQERFGIRTTLVLRTVDELKEVLAENPFLEKGIAEERLYVAFLAERPAAERVAALDPDRSPPDEFVVRGQEIYLRLLNGAGRSKLTTDYFESKLKTTATARNWRTVTNLLEMMEG
jgi:uncharacterized protein (DUF1697 family)